MQFSILDPVKPSTNYSDEFVLTGVAMFGDDDGRKDVPLGRFDNTTAGRQKLEEMVCVSERMVNAFPRGMSGQDNYKSVPGFIELLEDVWISDPVYDCDQAGFLGYAVFYYDTDGVKHPVEIIQ